ncbi:hypothetical protein L596_000809 [Steinernema carpocapsae]|uniref:Piwi domain-containing protein n=1 Tax=Steinernema carpocapsae TaxID=34508 RepID=A0A4U8ULI7_STECR|nr:hypothetical protein L596_000809 [Steinernema carpocapsae]
MRQRLAAHLHFAKSYLLMADPVPRGEPIIYQRDVQFLNIFVDKIDMLSSFTFQTSIGGKFFIIFRKTSRNHTPKSFYPCSLTASEVSSDRIPLNFDSEFSFVIDLDQIRHGRLVREPNSAPPQSSARPATPLLRPLALLLRLLDPASVEKSFYSKLVNVPTPPPEEKKPHGTAGRQLKLRTNVYGLSLPKDVQVFRYSVDASGTLQRNDLRIEFAKRVANDITYLNRREKCRRVIDQVVAKYSAIFGDRRELFWYDSQSILFSRNQLDISSEGQFVLDQSDIGQNPLFEGFAHLKMVIRPAQTNFAVSIGDLEAYIQAEVFESDHALQQFLEILTAQYAFNTPLEAMSFGSRTAYLLNPEKYGFKPADCADVGDGKFLGVGCDKSVRFIEGPGGAGSQRAALVVDLKKTAFHKDQSLYEKAREILNNRDPKSTDASRLRMQLKGIVVETKHGSRRQEFAVDNVVADTPATKKFKDLTGQEVTLQQYFQQKYNITLQHPDSPIVLTDRTKKFAAFPMEVCSVVDGQRVTLAQQTPVQIQKMIRQCAVPPADRQRQILGLVQGLQLNSENKYHKAASVGITPTALQVQARLLQNPTIVYGRNSTMKPDEKATWRLARQKPVYLKPAKVDKWAMFVICGGNRSDCVDQDILNQFSNMMVQECRARGMTVSDPTGFSFIGASREVVQETLEKAKTEGNQFCFFITNNDVTNIHQFMKFQERKLSIVTQDMKMSSAFDVVRKGKRQTLENVVNKTNMKNGGVNYSLRFDDPAFSMEKLLPKDRLVIGLATTHPKPIVGKKEQDEGPHDKKKQMHQQRTGPPVPSVVGVAANALTESIEIVGDCLFQQPNREEKIALLQPVIRSLMLQFMKHRGMPPAEIVVYRQGTSEGQFRDVMELEYKMVKAAALQQGLNPKITFIVVQKMHNVRLMPMDSKAGDKAPEQNVKPGTVVDTMVTHPKYNEFFLNSHVALQGSAAPLHSALRREPPPDGRDRGALPQPRFRPPDRQSHHLAARAALHCQPLRRTRTQHLHRFAGGLHQIEDQLPVAPQHHDRGQPGLRPHDERAVLLQLGA